MSTDFPARTPSSFALNDHPLRSSLSVEMHGRRLPKISAPARLMQVVLLLDEGQRDQEWSRMCEIFPELDASGPHPRFYRGKIEDLHVIWERHNEFSSHLFIRDGSFDAAFEPSSFSALPPDWFERLPGKAVRATQIALIDHEQPELVESFFKAEDLVHCDLLDGKVALWSDFRLNPDGFGRLLLLNRSASSRELALALQRVQELGNYRNLTLLGLPDAQRLGRRVHELELRLAEITQEIAESARDDASLLRDLSNLSAETARIRGESLYRMSASRAYSEMAEDRLRALSTRRVAGFESLSDFTERRLLPAARTCLSFSNRLDVLAQSAAWTSDLLRTRVDTELSIQNRDLLRSMDRRTGLQLRLQRTVEGLSVVAITYYALSLLAYLLHGLETSVALNHERAMAAAVPVTALIVWLAMRRIRSRLHK